MIFDFDNLSSNNRYHLITQTVLPRPIAWILTQNENQTYNVAPFSYFTALCSDPALLIVSIGNKSANTMKDTKHNLVKNKECILHIPSADLAEQVNQSAENLEYGESELEQLGLELVTYTDSLPRIKNAQVAMHCQLYDIHQLSASQAACYLEVQSLYINDDLVTQSENKTIIDSQAFNPLSRLGGNDYNILGQTLTIKRPT